MPGGPHNDDPFQPFAGEMRFHSTRWSLVHSAGAAGSSEAGVALEELCRAYWPPIYAEIRRRGHSIADAQDLAQEFFARLLRRNAFGQADEEKGRFRSYLLAALDYFLTDHLRARFADKRGGGAVMLSLDAEEGESWYQQQPANTATPAEAFDRQWALVLMHRALEALREDYTTRGRADLFVALQPFLAADTRGDDSESAAAAAGLSAEAFRVAVHRLRKRYREFIRAHVEMTVAEPGDVEDEMRHLFGL